MNNELGSRKLYNLRLAAFLVALFSCIFVLGLSVFVLFNYDDSSEDVKASELALIIALYFGAPLAILAVLSWFWPRIASVFAFFPVIMFLQDVIANSGSYAWERFILALLCLIVAVLNIDIWRRKRRFS